MNYIPEESKVIYQAKDGRQEKVFDAPEWLAAMCSHVPIKGESRRAGSVTMVITVSILMLDSCLQCSKFKGRKMLDFDSKATIILD
jgi:hypothetical protein